MGPELQSLAAASGASRGIAAVLLDDEALAQKVLNSEDLLAQFALLACARLTQMALPLAQVSAFFGSRNADLALAAECYLLAEDSPEARHLMLEGRPNAAFITGWRENYSRNLDAIARVEEGLRAEILQDNGPLEIYALLVNNKHGHHILRVYPNRAVYTFYEDASRYLQRAIAQADLAQFKGFITNNNLAEMGPQFSHCHVCSDSQYLSLTRQGGRRVFSHQEILGWRTIIANFELLGQGDGREVYYYIAGEIKGLKILYKSEAARALDVWQQGADLHVLVKRDATSEEIKEERKEIETEDESDADG